MAGKQRDSEFAWRDRLRAARLERGVSFAELARRTGLSLSAVKRYEGGSRRPSEGALNAIVDALGLPREVANQIRAGAGFAVDLQTLLSQRYLFDMESVQEQVEAYRWPVFVSNMAMDVLAANRAFQLVLGVDLSREFTGLGERNFLAGAGDPRFADFVENYDELVMFMIGLAKGDPRFAQNPERPAPWLRDAMTRFLSGDGAYIRRYLDLWESAPTIPHRTRHRYRVAWRLRDGAVLRFIGELSIADLWNELSWNQWIPADVASWQALEEIIHE